MMDEELLEGDPILSGARKAVPSTLRAPFNANSGCRQPCFLRRGGTSWAFNRHNVGEYRWAFVLHL
jgi:hypothetical protein